MLVYGKYESLVIQMLYVCVLCSSYCSSQSRSHDCLIGSHESLFLFAHPVAVNAFIICSGLGACTEML